MMTSLEKLFIKQYLSKIINCYCKECVESKYKITIYIPVAPTQIYYNDEYSITCPCDECLHKYPKNTIELIKFENTTICTQPIRCYECLEYRILCLEFNLPKTYKFNTIPNELNNKINELTNLIDQKDKIIYQTDKLNIELANQVKRKNESKKGLANIIKRRDLIIEKLKNDIINKNLTINQLKNELSPIINKKDAQIKLLDAQINELSNINQKNVQIEIDNINGRIKYLVKNIYNYFKLNNYNTLEKNRIIDIIETNFNIKY